MSGYDGNTLNTVYEFSLDKYCQVKKDVQKAEISNNITDISDARNSVNAIEESTLKDELQNRLNMLIPNFPNPNPKTDSNIFNIYIKPRNTISMSINTNSITFNNFSATEDMKLDRGINLTIDSSLPYQINTYLVDEIKSNNKNQTIDSSILHIKESNQTQYMNFSDINKKLTLKDNCLQGVNINHSIDLMLSTKNAIDSDVYRSTIKFEIQQK